MSHHMGRVHAAEDPASDGHRLACRMGLTALAVAVIVLAAVAAEGPRDRACAARCAKGRSAVVDGACFCLVPADGAP